MDTAESEPPQLLLIYGGHEGGRTFAMVDAVKSGIAGAEEHVELRSLRALDAGVEDLLWADGLIIGTPEHFGYMSGAVKDFMDRTFYPTEGKVAGLPYAVFVSASNDGSGAVNSIERIAIGYRWKRICDPLIVKGELDATAIAQCRELGETMATGLALRIW